jgi:hypothetical protein
MRRVAVTVSSGPVMAGLEGRARSGHDTWRSSGAPEQAEQAARLAFKGSGGIAAVGAAAGTQSHDPERGKQPEQLCYLLALTGIEVEAVKVQGRLQP